MIKNTSISQRLKRFNLISDKIVNDKPLTLSDIEYIENNMNNLINELKSEIGWLCTFTDILSMEYELKLK